MIGTTLRIGFDSSKADSGMRGLSSRIGRIGRQVGIGVARQVGARVTDLFGRIVTAVPRALTETADWAGGMTDMATATGVAIDELILLEEKLRLSGAKGEAGRILTTFTDNLFDARTEAGEAREAINKLGFFAPDFEGKSAIDAFNMIGQSVASFSGEVGELENITSALFGARIGSQLQKFFLDLKANTVQAESNVRKLADQMGAGQAAKLDRFADSLGRFETLKRSLASIALDELFRLSGGSDAGNKLFDSLDPEKIRPVIQNLTSYLGRSLESVLQNGFDFGGIIKNLGRKFGEGIKESFSDSLSISGIAKGLFGMGSNQEKISEADVQAPKQTAILEDLRRMSGTPKFQ